MIYAPIVVSVYDRLPSLKRCISCLAENPIAGSSDLIIVSDAAARPEAEQVVEAVRRYAQGVRGFKRVTTLARAQNLGSFASVKLAIDEIIREYGRLIFLEDDNVVAPNFLSFVNDCLEYYHDDSGVFSVSAYNFPIRVPVSYEHDVYTWPGFSAWGVGLWRDKWESVAWSYRGLEERRMRRAIRRRLDRVGEHLFPIIEQEMKHGRLIIDSRVSFHVVMNGLVSVFPVVSKVRNLGHDGSGEHSGYTERFRYQMIDEGRPYRLSSGLKPDRGISRELRAYFKVPGHLRLFYAASRLIPGPARGVAKKILGVHDLPAVRIAASGAVEAAGSPSAASAMLELEKTGMQAEPLMVAEPRRAEVKQLLRRVRHAANTVVGRSVRFPVQADVPCERFGSEYGGWWLSPQGITSDSIVYSLGIGMDASFDLALIAKYGLTVHAFDPTPQSITWARAQGLPPRFVLHAVGIAGYDGQASFFPPENPDHVSYTLLERPTSGARPILVEVRRISTVMQQQLHSHIDIVKMDIEGAEYGVLEDILESRIAVHQILVEFHHRFPGVGAARTRAAVRSLNKAGYKIFAVSASGEEYSFSREF